MTAQELIERHEGRRLDRYLDTEGNATIGVGHLCKPDETWETITNEECDKIFADDLLSHKIDLDVNLPWARALDDVRYAVLLDMCFNLGIHRLLGFHNALKYARAHQFEDSAREMLDSKWAIQVKSRAIEDADMMRSGEWPA